MDPITRTGRRWSTKYTEALDTHGLMTGFNTWPKTKLIPSWSLNMLSLPFISCFRIISLLLELPFPHRICLSVEVVEPNCMYELLLFSVVQIYFVISQPSSVEVYFKLARHHPQVTDSEPVTQVLV